MLMYLTVGVIVFLIMLIITAVKMPQELNYTVTFTEMIESAVFWPLTLLYLLAHMIVLLRKEN